MRKFRRPNSFSPYTDPSAHLIAQMSERAGDRIADEHRYRRLWDCPVSGPAHASKPSPACPPPTRSPSPVQRRGARDWPVPRSGPYTPPTSRRNNANASKSPSSVVERRGNCESSRLDARCVPSAAGATRPSHGASIWITRSRSPTSMPSSSVDVATMTQSRSSGTPARPAALGAAERRMRTKVRTPCRDAMPANSSARFERLSQNTSRFSPRCSRASPSLRFERPIDGRSSTSPPSVLRWRSPTTAALAARREPRQKLSGLPPSPSGRSRCDRPPRRTGPAAASTAAQCQPRSSPRTRAARRR